MSGNLIEGLQEPVIYPHWMWILGVALLLAVLGWVAYSLWAWWHSREGSVAHLQTFSQARRARYHDYVNQIAQRRACGELDERGTHLAVAGLMRALGTERSGRVLEACETPSFVGERADGATGGPSLPGGAQGAGGTDILILASQAVDA